MKKRNHVNRFMADHPDAVFAPLTSESIPLILEFYNHQPLPQGKSETAWFDRRETIDMLHHLSQFGFYGAMLSTPEQGVVAFTLGEIIDDTLYVHIEKWTIPSQAPGKPFAATSLPSCSATIPHCGS